MVSAGVSADPLDRGAGQLGSLSRAADDDIGDVDGSDGPASLSEPVRVGAFTTADIEHPAWGDVGYLGDEPPVGAARSRSPRRSRCTSRPTRAAAAPRRTAARRVPHGRPPIRNGPRSGHWLVPSSGKLFPTGPPPAGI
jgi:hypothetical protein